MLSIQRIVCPTDFSEPSLRALDIAAELARRFGAELLVVHAISPVPAMPYTVSSRTFNVALYLKEVNDAARLSLSDLLATRVPAEVRSEVEICHGEPGSEISRVAAERRADLIVIASHGRTGWRRLVYGSVAEKVIRHAPCMVLAVPAKQPERAEGGS